MSRGIAYRRGLVRSLLAVVVSAGASSWAGEKIEMPGSTVVLPASTTTNKTGKADEPSVEILRFEKRINEMDSRFGWQGGLPGNRPRPGNVAPIPAPAPAARRDSDKNDRKSKDWLSAPADGTLDYEASLGVTMFSTPKASATASSATGTSTQRPRSGASAPSDAASMPGAASDPFASPLQSYVRPDSINTPSLSGIRQEGFPGSGGAFRAPIVLDGFNAPAPIGGLPTDLAPERTLDGILGRSVDRPQNALPTVNSVLSGSTPSLSDPRRFETGVDAVLRQYRPVPTTVEAIAKPQGPSVSAIPTAPTLDDVLSSTRPSFDVNNARRTTLAPEPSRGFVDPRNRPPAILPGPKPSFGGF